MVYAIWAAALILSVTVKVVTDYRERSRRQRFNKETEKLMFIAIRECGCTGAIKMPRYNGQTAWNAETGKEELIYTKMDDDGRTRTIFVSRDGEDVRAFPWREANDGTEETL